ncbi:hypothetical protein [Streptomyces sp. NPDC051569]|uniref:hypothetical protein n=1 Tax=Streptomyces sp. NPDC051569 TaxID=3365661 RepID=UPI00378937BA
MKHPPDHSPGHPPDCPSDAVELRRPLQELSAVERWAQRAGAGGRPEPYTSEESLEGPEFSVETMTRNGMHRVVGMTAREQRGDPDPGGPTETEAAVLRSVVRALLDLAGHESGPARTGVVLTARGPRIVACCLQGTADRTVQESRASFSANP